MSTNDQHEKQVLTTGDVAKICSVAPRTVSKWFDSGQLGGYRIPGSKDRRIPIDQLIRFMQTHNMPLNGLSPKGIKIVWYDHDREFANTLSSAMSEYEDYTLTLVDTAFEAGAAVFEQQPSVLVVDVSQPDVVPAEISRYVRTKPKLRGMMTIGIGKELVNGQGQALLQAGFDAYLCKPFELGSFFELITQSKASL